MLISIVRFSFELRRIVEGGKPIKYIKMLGYRRGALRGSADDV